MIKKIRIINNISSEIEFIALNMEGEINIEKVIVTSRDGTTDPSSFSRRGLCKLI
ncbi:hypothetical protein EMIT079MI2_110134 [Bacillus sp. IT-79MI2]